MLGVTGKDVGVLSGRQTRGDEVKLARAEARTQQLASSDQCQDGAHTGLSQDHKHLSPLRSTLGIWAGSGSCRREQSNLRGSRASPMMLGSNT